MAHYMLLLRNEPDGWGHLSPEEMQKTMEKYIEWRTRPFVVDGNGLVDKTGRVVQKEGASVTDGPFTESNEVMGGYYTIEAATWDEAVNLALTNPHLKFGSIEVREVIAKRS
jgi:hypothetical protein